MDNIKDVLTKIYSDTDNVCKDFSTLLKVILYEFFGEKIEVFYNIVNDNDLFSKILEMFGGKQIEFPTVEEFKSSITLALVYYYKEILGYDWKKIEELIPYERDISLRYGTKIKKIQKSMKKHLSNINKKSKKENSLFEL